MPRIDQALSQPLLIAGCEPIPFAAATMVFLGTTALFSFSPNVALPLLPVYIGVIINLRKAAELDPKLFRISWANSVPGVRAAILGKLGVGQSIWDMPTAQRRLPLIKTGLGKRTL